jgi:DNA-binding CsgD family transcriptional regulator/tetratricopeptide (TPR) repeat protein
VTVLREREHELVELDAALGRVGDGQGCAVAVEGGAGLGKTRLLEEVRASGVGMGFEALSARATDLERDFPFSLIRQLFEVRLSSMSGDEREVLFEGADAARGALGLELGVNSTPDSFAVLHGLYWVIAALAEKQPLILTVDDIHLADAGSLDYFGFLLPRLDELSILLVVAARPNEPDPSGGIRRVLNDTSVRNLPLSPLSNAAATELLVQELGESPDTTFADACHELTGGNPFLVRELGRSLVEQRIEPTSEHVEAVRKLAPERVARMVLARVGRLSGDARRVADAISVLGEDSESSVVAELTGIGIEAVQRAADELRSAAILDPAVSLRFMHPLIRNSVYTDLPPGERAGVHARAAALLRNRGAAPERIGAQLLASDARAERETVEVLVEAGERALASGVPRSAIAYLTRAWREPPPPELRAAVLVPLLTAVLRAADGSVFERVEDEVSAELGRDPSLRSRLAPQLALMMSLGQGRFEEAGAMLRGALEVAMAEDDVERAFQLEVQLRGLAMLGLPGSDDGPEMRLDRYADRIDPDSRAGRLAAAMEIPSTLTSGTARDAVAAAQRALARNGAFYAEEPEFIASGMPVSGLLLAGEVDAAMRGAEQALASAREHDATPVLVLAWFLRARVEFARGDLVAAEADMRQAIDLGRLAGLTSAALLVSASPLMEIQIERDELEAAEAQLAEYGIADGPMPTNLFFDALRLRRGHLRFERGEFELAAEDFAELPAEMEHALLGPIQVAALSPIVARTLAAVGEEPRARELCDQIEAAASRWGASITISQALRARAAVQGGEAGESLLVEAARLLESAPNRLERAHTLFELGATRRRRGHRADSRTPLRAASRLARQCGAVRLAKRVNGELEASGALVRRYAPFGVESLTPSERRVAELAASGMTNRQIAQSLFVTVKTVEAHLSASYDKLDIRSRGQLADAIDGKEESELPTNPRPQE